MRLKEIKPGMVIHCKTEDEIRKLLQEAKSLGYTWPSGQAINTEKDLFETICFYDAYIAWTERRDDEIEFSNLILPELTAEEALLAYDQMCKENYCCNDCPIYKIIGDECAHRMEGHISEIMDAIKQWKSEHDKKEPEIETVDICMIIEIQPDGRKRCVHEEEIKPELPFDAEKDVEKILKHYCMEHDGEFIAVHDVVSRVKKCE